jgi:hypothetical protein
MEQLCLFQIMWMLLLAYSEFNTGSEIMGHIRRNKLYQLDCQANYTVDKDVSYLNIILLCLNCSGNRC